MILSTSAILCERLASLRNLARSSCRLSIAICPTQGGCLFDRLFTTSPIDQISNGNTSGAGVICSGSCGPRFVWMFLLSSMLSDSMDVRVLMRWISNLLTNTCLGVVAPRKRRFAAMKAAQSTGLFQHPDRCACTYSHALLFAATSNAGDGEY
jgi:hypothetical protein